MDIPLECFDTYIFDYFYSALLPAQPAPYSWKNGLSNSSSAADASTWTYQPATKFISFEPRAAAYNSQWTRDNIYRQMMSLFIITW